MRLHGWIVAAVLLGLAALSRAEFGDPLCLLTLEEQQRFEAGREAFKEIEDVAAGLGPVFNGTSCAGCHNVGAVGGGSTQVETRFGTITDVAFDPLAALGGSLIQVDGIGIADACTFVGEVVPAQATIVTGRRTTPLFGLGLVDAIPDVGLLDLAEQEAVDHPETAGRALLVIDAPTGEYRIGRFGWKDQVSSLLHFAGDAYLNEMGITSPTFLDENCPQGDCTLLACDPVPDPENDGEDVDAFRDFMMLLAPPPLGSESSRSVQRGSRLFDAIGCANCHVRTMVTGPSDVEALRFQVFQPYSDFLLHDMGSLGDGIEQNGAIGTEMRTAPLWGLQVLTSFLHDGRAQTIEEAIVAHEGQGRYARNRFMALRAGQQERVLAFLGQL